MYSEIRTKFRDWAVWRARAGCYSQAALSSNDSKTQYITTIKFTDNLLPAISNLQVLPSTLSTATTSAFKPVPILKHKESTEGATAETSGGILKNPAQQTATNSKPDHVRIR